MRSMLRKVQRFLGTVRVVLNSDVRTLFLRRPRTRVLRFDFRPNAGASRE
jgi:hypothetical protein